jgi:hypothetical protein
VNDNDLDRMLESAGAAWRARHQHVADVDPENVARSRRGFAWVPVAAAVAVVGLLGVAVVVTRGVGASPHVPASPTDRSPSPSPTGRAIDVAPGSGVDFLGDGRIILSQRDRPGIRSGLELRSLSDPTHATAAVTSTYAKGGYLTCPTIDGDWLVYTDVESVRTTFSPGPPSPWTLIARNIATGEQRVLDSGVADMGNEFACAVRAGQRLAWTAGAARHTSVYDIPTTSTRSVSVAGWPVGFVDAGVLIASYAADSTVGIVLADPSTGRRTNVATLDHAANVRFGDDDRLVWSERSGGPEGGGPTLVHVCSLSTCGAADSAKSVIGSAATEPSTFAIGAGFVAWPGDTSPVTVTRFDGTVVTGTGEGDAFSVAADGTRLAYVAATDPSTAQEKDTLYVVDIAAG